MNNDLSFILTHGENSEWKRKKADPKTTKLKLIRMSNDQMHRHAIKKSFRLAPLNRGSVMFGKDEVYQKDLIKSKPVSKSNSVLSLKVP